MLDWMSNTSSGLRSAPGTGPQNCCRGSRWWAGWCALLFYAVAYSPVGLGVAALLGSCDPRHQPQVNVGVPGLQLVLHHGPGCSAHPRVFVARTLAILAPAAGPADPDHVIQFAAADSLLRPARLSGEGAASLAQPDQAFSGTFPQSLRNCMPVLPPAQPPPEVAARTPRIRSTVLLI